MNETQPKISVIVPVYKAEDYLHRCVDSLLAQTFRDFEVLLVDDGSPDCSGRICDDYACKDSRIKVFHKGNGGVSSARQYGTDNARGEYVIHADPDDWVEPTMLEELYGKACVEDADMVICDYYVDTHSGTTYSSQRPSQLNSEIVLQELFQQLHGSCCNKLVRRVCYSRFAIGFPLELSYCEDLFVNVCLLSHNLRVAYLDKAFYHYDQIVNGNSLVHKPYAFIAEQNKKFRHLLGEKLPANIYGKLKPYLLCQHAVGALRDGHSFLCSFRTDYGELKSLWGQLDVNRKWKFILWIAFYVSPYVAHVLYRSWLRMRCAS